MSEVLEGTIRFYIRPGFEKATAPILGFAIKSLPDGVEDGDCVEVRLLPGGAATWSVVKKHAHQDAHYSFGRDANAEFSEGIAGMACFPDLFEEKYPRSEYPNMWRSEP